MYVYLIFDLFATKKGKTRRKDVAKTPKGDTIVRATRIDIRKKNASKPCTIQYSPHHPPNRIIRERTNNQSYQRFSELVIISQIL